MKLSVIAALTDDGVIGLNNQLPWKISEDLKHFKKLTMGHALIMGRKTFDSMGKPLQGRTNIVLSRNPKMSIPGAVVVPSFEIALKKAQEIDPEPFAVGGSAVFEKALPIAHRIYLTLIHKNFSGDAFFPDFDRSQFKLLDRKEGKQAEGDSSFSYEFLTYERP